MWSLTCTCKCTEKKTSSAKKPRVNPKPSTIPRYLGLKRLGELALKKDSSNHFWTLLPFTDEPSPGIGSGRRWVAQDCDRSSHPRK